MNAKPSPFRVRGSRILALVIATCVPDIAWATAAPRQVPTTGDLTSADWTSIRAAHEAARHRAFVVDDSYRARNFAQGWTANFDGRGLGIAPDGGEWAFGLDLVHYGFEGAERCVGARAEARAEGCLVSYDWDETLTEWYVNGPSGLEHGYTLRRRPDSRDCEADGPLRFAVAVRGGLRAEVAPSGRDVRFFDEQGVPIVTYEGLLVLDADGQELAATLETTELGLELSIDEHGARYPLTIDPLIQAAYLKASNTNARDEFGGAVAVSGDTVVIGAARESSDATGVNGNQANNLALYSGAAYVFVRNGASWSQEAYLKASNTEAFDWFGYSVAISGDTIVVGAFGEDSNAIGLNGNQASNSALFAGAAYVFVRSGGTWSQQAYFKASNTDAHDYFGVSVSISGHTAVIGAFREDSIATGVNGSQSNHVSAPDSGAAYVFVRNGTAWSQQAYVKASNTGQYDEFGVSVAISGDILVVGAHGDDSGSVGVNGEPLNHNAGDSGAAFTFVRNGNSWSQEAYLKASNTDWYDGFGYAVAVSGETVVVGAVEEDSGATGVGGEQVNNDTINSGAVYAFVRSGGTWSQEAYIKASNTGENDFFGYAVALSGDVLVVGAPWEDSSATSLNGDQSNDGAGNAGAAYVFARGGGGWRQEAYVKSSNTDPNDWFGASVAVSGDIVVVGAPLEDSSAVGINGSQANDGAVDSGAAYVFAITAAGPVGAVYCAPGVANSSGSSGTIQATGTATVASNQLTLVAGSMPSHSFGYFLTSRAQGHVPQAGGSTGVLCLGGAIGRYVGPGQVLNSGAAGVLQLALDLQRTPTPTGTVAVLPGETWYFQAWHRDAVGGVATSNFTHGLAVTFF